MLKRKTDRQTEDNTMNIARILCSNEIKIRIEYTWDTFGDFRQEKKVLFANRDVIK